MTSAESPFQKHKYRISEIPRQGLIMPFYLCENCARDKVKLDLTFAGINQLWLRTSPNPEGFGPPCEFCNAPKTVYQVQLIGAKFDTEGQHLEKMKAEVSKIA